MPERTLFLATRGSALALAQTNMVIKQLKALFPSLQFEIKVIKTTGDKLQTASLADAQLPKGLFTKELENALLAGDADLAVHSLKDLPTDLPEGLKLGAVSQRADVRDVLIYRDASFAARESGYAWAGATGSSNTPKHGFAPGTTVAQLPKSATVATSSTRRRAQLLERRPDLKIASIRGNVGTRLNKLAAQGEIDGIVLAAAGLERLGFHIDAQGMLRGENIPNGLLAVPIAPNEMLPCVGQAALGIEVRANDPLVEEICHKLNDRPTMQCVRAERAFLRQMGGGCQIAVGAYAQLIEQKLRMNVVSFLGDRPRRAEGEGAFDDPEELGARLARLVRN
jgi:hydroxymethylbilane synthase